MKRFKLMQDFNSVIKYFEIHFIHYNYIKKGRENKVWYILKQWIVFFARSSFVRTHEKNSGDVFADWAQSYKAFFVPNQKPASA